MKKIFVLIIISICIQNVFAEKFIKVKQDSIIAKNYHIPLYMQGSGLILDYRSNQPLRAFTKSTGIGTFTISTLSLTSNMIYNRRALSNYSRYILLGTAIPSIPIGLLYGSIKGYILHNKKKKYSSYCIAKCHYGVESSSGATLINRLGANPKIYIVYRTKDYNPSRPSEYRFGIGQNSFDHIKDNGLFSDVEYKEGYTFENRGEFSFLFNSCARNVNPYFGAGIGYSKGKVYIREEEDDSNNYSDFNRVTLEGVYFKAIAGLSLNFSDFFFIRAEADCELSSFYFKALDYYDYPINSNFHISFNFGTYIY